MRVPRVGVVRFLMPQLRVREFRGLEQSLQTLRALGSRVGRPQRAGFEGVVVGIARTEFQEVFPGLADALAHELAHECHFVAEGGDLGFLSSDDLFLRGVRALPMSVGVLELLDLVLHALVEIFVHRNCPFWQSRWL